MLRQGAGSFEIPGELQQRRFRICLADELQADGQIILCESAWHGDRWNAREICRAIEAQKQGARRIRFFADDDGFFADFCGGDGRRGDDEGVEILLIHGCVKSRDEAVAEFHGFQEIDGQYGGAFFHTVAHVVAVLG